MKSEEDIEVSDDERDAAVAHNYGADIDDTDDSLGRATGTDRSLRSIADLADRSITKVSSTRKLNDQGGEGFLQPMTPLKDVDSSMKGSGIHNNKAGFPYSRNETFAAGSRAFLHSTPSQRSLHNKNGDNDSDVKSETYLIGQQHNSLSF